MTQKYYFQLCMVYRILWRSKCPQGKRGGSVGGGGPPQRHLVEVESSHVKVFHVHLILLLFLTLC